MAITKAGMLALDRARKSDPRPALPWGGRSPRVLTEAWKAFNLESRRDDLNDSFFVWDGYLIDKQCQRHLYGW